MIGKSHWRHVSTVEKWSIKSELKSNSKFLYDWRLPPISSSWPQATWDPRPEIYLIEPLRSYSLCNNLSDEKMSLSLMNLLGLLSSVSIVYGICYWKFFLLHYTQVLCQSRHCKVGHAYLTYLTLQRQLSHLNGSKLEPSLSLKSKSKSKLCYDRQSVGQSVLVTNTHLGLTSRSLLLSDSCGFVDVGRSLWQENGSAVYNYCWFSPAQSFLGPSPAGPVTIFHCLRFEVYPTWRAWSPYLYPLGTRWSSYTPRHWVPFLSPPMTYSTMVEVFEPATTELLRTEFKPLKSKSKLYYEQRFSRPICLGMKHPSGAYDQIFIPVRQLQACCCGARSLSDERTGLSFARLSQQ
jgi:hypothetical protein